MKDTQKYSYIQLANTLWQVHLTSNLSTTDIALYFRLLHINNSCYWKESFQQNNRALEGSLNITYKTLAKARNNLLNAGLITFQTQNGNPNVFYQILSSPQTYGNFPTFKDVGRDDINKRKIKRNTIKEDDVDFSIYKEFLKSEKFIDQKEAIYKLYKLTKGSLEKLANNFEAFQIANGTAPKGTLNQIHKHFVNWIQKQETMGKLKEYKIPSHKSIGAI